MPPQTKTKPKTKNPPSTPSQITNPQSQPPDWPPLKPLVPTTSLTLTTLHADQILAVSNFFPAKLCKDYVSFLQSLPLLTTPGKPRKGEAVRVNDRFQIEDAAFAERLWSGTSLKELVLGCEDEGLWGGDVIGLNPNIRIYRYRVGQFFAQHYDDSNTLSLASKPARTTWTLLIYLTSPSTGCTGGETIFYPEAVSKSQPTPDPIVVGLETGMALLHRHGDRCMLHEGAEVRAGEKWVIRSDLCVRR